MPSAPTFVRSPYTSFFSYFTSFSNFCSLSSFSPSTSYSSSSSFFSSSSSSSSMIFPVFSFTYLPNLGTSFHIQVCYSVIEGTTSCAFIRVRSVELSRLVDVEKKLVIDSHSMGATHQRNTCFNIIFSLEVKIIMIV